MQAVRRNPAARAALRRVQGRLRAVANVFQSLGLEQARTDQQAAIAQLVEQVRQELRDAGDELMASGLPTPKSLEDWEHLARVIEMPFDTIRSGKYTFQDVVDMALAWLDRKAILRARTAAARPTGDRGQEKSARTFTVAALRVLTGLGNTTLNKYARVAGVKTARRGQRNFCYRQHEARRILNAIIAHTGEASVITRCRAALREIAE